MGDWRERAACLDQDPELFFPIGEAGHSPDAQIADAVAVCHRCEVAKECLRFAVDINADHGIWGGRTDGERLSMKRRSRGVIHGDSRCFVSPVPAVRKIREALADGWTCREIGRAAGTGADAISRLSRGLMGRIFVATAQKIMDADLNQRPVPELRSAGQFEDARASR